MQPAAQGRLDEICAATNDLRATGYDLTLRSHLADSLVKREDSTLPRLSDINTLQRAHIEEEERVASGEPGGERSPPPFETLDALSTTTPEDLLSASGCSTSGVS